MTIRIHFFGLEADRKPIPLAGSAGVGGKEQTVGADTRRYERLWAEGPQRWVAVGEEEADLFAYCYSYADNEATRAGALRARALQKPCLFFHLVDDTSPTAPPYGVVYRESLLASQRRDHEQTMPAFADDLLRETGGMRLLTKCDRPSIGFCGYVGAPWNRLLYRIQGRQRKVLGLSLRDRALRLFEASSRVDTDFVRRTQFWGGAISRFRGPDPDAKRRVRAEYLENLAANPYTLCLRGAGNFSYRFYETLAMGRVPVFVNTDCELPFADAIDWRRHVVWVEEHAMPQIADRLAEFHATLSDDAFQQLQRSNRELWETHLRPTEGYQRVLDRVLRDR